MQLTFFIFNINPKLIIAHHCLKPICDGHRNA